MSRDTCPCLPLVAVGTVFLMPTLDHAGARLHWEAAGPEEAPALLFLHAGIATSAMWDPLWSDLQRDFRVIRYDLRWFGNSPSDDVEYSNRADAVAVLDAAGVEQAIFIGALYGGAVAIDTALEYLDRVAGLVTIGSGPSGFPDVEPTGRERELQAPIEEAEEARDWDRLVELEALFWGVGPTRETADVDPIFLQRLRELGHENKPLLDGDPRPVPMEPRAYGRLGDITVPALFIVGEHDTTAARAQAEHLAEAVDGASLHVFPGTAHVPSIEYPQPFLGLLREWLTERVAG